MNATVLYKKINWENDISIDKNLMQRHCNRIKTSAYNLISSSDLQKKNINELIKILNTKSIEKLHDPLIYQQVILCYRGKSSASKLYRIINDQFSSAKDPLFKITFEGYGNNEAAIVKDKVIKTLKTIQQDFPGLMTFIREYIKRMVFVKGGECMTSRSNIQLVGQLEIGNVHFNKVTEHLLISTLLHESIHNFLYLHEEDRRFQVVPEKSVPVHSPWSGNPICLHSFIHACFVWYSLDSFWRGPSKMNKWKKESNLLFKKVHRGFSNEDFNLITNKHRNLIREDVFMEIINMKNEISQRNTKNDISGGHLARF